LTLEPLPAVQDQGLNGFNDWRALVADVSGSRMLEAWVLYGTRAKDLAQFVEPDFLANIKLDEDENRATQRRIKLDLGQVCGLGWVKKDLGV